MINFENFINFHIISRFHSIMYSPLLKVNLETKTTTNSVFLFYLIVRDSKVTSAMGALFIKEE